MKLQTCLLKWPTRVLSINIKQFEPIVRMNNLCFLVIPLKNISYYALKKIFTYFLHILMLHILLLTGDKKP